MGSVEKNKTKFKASIERRGSELVISSPSRKSLSLVIFMAASSGLWILGEKVVISLILSISVLEGHGYFFLFWFIVWTFLGFILFTRLVWHLTGKEVVTITSDIFKIEKVYLGIRKSREYHLQGLEDLRIEIPSSSRNRRSLLFNLFFKGFLKFDYGVRTITFLSGVEEEEAVDILEEINSYRGRK